MKTHTKIGLTTIATVIFLAYQGYTAFRPELPPTIKHCPCLMTQKELQTGLKARGYDIGKHGVDGKVGDDTKLAWRKYEEDSYFDRILENVK